MGEFLTTWPLPTEKPRPLPTARLPTPSHRMIRCLVRPPKAKGRAPGTAEAGAAPGPGPPCSSYVVGNPPSARLRSGHHGGRRGLGTKHAGGRPGPPSGPGPLMHGRCSAHSTVTVRRPLGPPSLPAFEQGLLKYTYIHPLDPPKM